MKEVSAYRCQYCGKVYLKRHACKKHEEKICQKNPVIRPLCYSCQHYHEEMDEQETVVYHLEVYFRENSYEKKFDLNACHHPQNCQKLYNNVKLSDEMREGLSHARFFPMPTRKTGGCKFYKAIPDHPYADNQIK